MCISALGRDLMASCSQGFVHFAIKLFFCLLLGCRQYFARRGLGQAEFAESVSSMGNTRSLPRHASCDTWYTRVHISMHDCMCVAYMCVRISMHACLHARCMVGMFMLCVCVCWVYAQHIAESLVHCRLRTQHLCIADCEPSPSKSNDQPTADVPRGIS